MKKIRILIVLFSLIIIATVAAYPSFAALSETAIKTNVTGATFYVPMGWTDVSETIDNSEVVKAKLVCDNDNSVVITYSFGDVWAALTSEQAEAFNHDRRNVTNDTISKKDIAEGLNVDPSEISVKTYGDYEYYVFLMPVNFSETGVDLTINVYTAAAVVNGYTHIFQFNHTEDSQYFSDFEELLGSTYLGPPPSDVSAHAVPNTYITPYAAFLLSLLLTMLVYSAPIFIYRYIIRKSPVNHNKGIIITICYAIIGLVIMAVILFQFGSHPNGMAITLWSFVNYKMLTHGYQAPAASLSNEKTEDNEPIMTEEQAADALIEQNVYKPNYIQSHILNEDGTVSDCQMDANKIIFDYTQYLYNGELYLYKKTKNGKTRNVIIKKDIFEIYKNQYNRK